MPPRRNRAIFHHGTAGVSQCVFLARLGQGSYTFSHAWRPQGGVRSSMGAIKVWPLLSRAVLLFGACLEPGSTSSSQISPKRNMICLTPWYRLLLVGPSFSKGCPTRFVCLEHPWNQVPNRLFNEVLSKMLVLYRLLLFGASFF